MKNEAEKSTDAALFRRKAEELLKNKTKLCTNLSN